MNCWANGKKWATHSVHSKIFRKIELFHTLSNSHFQPSRGDCFPCSSKTICILSNHSDFNGGRLWGNARCHKRRMTHSDTQSRNQTRKIHWPAKSIQYLCIFWNMKSNNRRQISVTDCSQNSASSVYVNNSTNCYLIPLGTLHHLYNVC